MYIAELAKQLATPHLLKRSSIASLPSSLKQSIKTVTGQDPPRREVPQGTVYLATCSDLGLTSSPVSGRNNFGREPKAD
ncbi:hypothetical protein J6590_078572 [Homalodisca vitripennis]|nr:hypothetical protein J6590_078572 [Homalodisca vitripennis]